MATSLFPDANPVQVPFGFPAPLQKSIARIRLQVCGP